MKNTSIAVIGGYDGPTAIFVTGSPWLTIGIATVVIVAVIAGIVLLLNKRTK